MRFIIKSDRDPSSFLTVCRDGDIKWTDNNAGLREIISLKTALDWVDRNFSKEKARNQKFALRNCIKMSGFLRRGFVQISS